MAHCQLDIYQNPTGLLQNYFPARQLPACACSLDYPPSRWRTLHSSLLNSMRFFPTHFTSLFRTLQMTAQPWTISHSSQFCIICKLARGALSPYPKLFWAQYQPLGYNTHDWPPTGLCAFDHNHFYLAVQFLIHLTISLSSAYFISLSMRILQKIRVESLAKSR